MTRQDLSTAIFGASDGAVSLLGVLAGLYVAHASPAALLATCGGLAIANTVSMAGGQRLSGSSWRLAGVMGAATLAGSLLPALLPALLPGVLGYGLGAATVFGLGVVIAEYRQLEIGRARSYGESLGIVVLAGVLAVATALLFGAGG